MERDPRVDPRKGDIISSGKDAYLVIRYEDECVEYADVENLPDLTKSHLTTLKDWRMYSVDDDVLWPRRVSDGAKR